MLELTHPGRVQRAVPGTLEILMRTPARFLAAGIAASLAHAAAADVVTLSASKDNTLFFDAEGDVSNGSGQHFFSGRNTQGNVRRAVIAFDLSSLPAGATITNATLQLNMSSGDDTLYATTVHALLADWGEGTSDAPGAE